MGWDEDLGGMMGQINNIYCDESCHLLNKLASKMTLGLIWCPVEKTKEIANRIRELKIRHKLNRDFEIKWNKISKTKKKFYLDVIDYFFDDDDLHFRAVVAEKNGLDHEAFNQSHDDWYYKMMFLLISNVLDPSNEYCVYLDIKDTCSSLKTKKLHDILCNSLYDFNHSVIKKVQSINSRESAQMQIADLLMGAIEYTHRDLSGSCTKLEIINLIKQRSKYDLTKNTLARESKLNIFHWQPQKPGEYYGF